MKTDIYVPSNVLKFKCKMCGECCKKKWTIFANKHEYKYIKELYKSKGLNKTFNEVFTTVDKDSFDKYARLEFSCGKCRLLNENNMCSMQIEFGADALTKTCFSYPKNANQSLRGLEVYMYYSCDVALKTLDTDEPLYVVKNPDNYVIRFKPNPYQIQLSEKLKEFYLLFEDFLLKVMQNRNLSIQQRLLVLTYIVENSLNLRLDERDLPKLFEVVSNAQTIMNSGELLRNLGASNTNVQYQMAYIISTINNKDNRFDLINETIKDVNKIFDLKNWQEDIEKIATRYEGYYYKLFKPYEKSVENIIENYLCQFIFRKEFTKSFQNGIFITILYFSLIRFFSIYLCVVQNKTLDKAILLESIKIIESGFVHNSYTTKAIEEIIKEKRVNMSQIISLFKM